MNQEMGETIRKHLVRQMEVHGAVLVLANTNPGLGKAYGRFWQPIHLLAAALTFFATVAEERAAKSVLLPR
jgi:hypothetical protein